MATTKPKMTKAETVKGICDRTGITKEEVLKDFDKIKEDMKDRFKDKPEEFVEERAVTGLAVHYKKLMQSQATEWKGYITGYDDGNDRMNKQLTTAAKMFRENKDKAVAEGYTDSNGTPLVRDTAKKTFGKPMRSFIARGIYGICSAKDKPARLFELTYTSDDVKKLPIPPLFKFVKFRARPKGADTNPDLYILSSVPETAFEEVVDSTAPPVDDAIKKFYKPVEDVLKVEQNTIFSYACVIQSLDLETSSGSKRMSVIPVEFDLDTPPTNVYMPSQFDFQSIDGLAEGVKIILMAKKGRNNEDGSCSANGFGIWVFPEDRSTVKKTEPIKKDDIKKDAW